MNSVCLFGRHSRLLFCNFNSVLHRNCSGTYKFQTITTRNIYHSSQLLKSRSKKYKKAKKNEDDNQKDSITNVLKTLTMNENKLKDSSPELKRIKTSKVIKPPKEQKSIHELVKDVSKVLHPNEKKKQQEVKADIFQKLIIMENTKREVKDDTIVTATNNERKPNKYYKGEKPQTSNRQIKYLVDMLNLMVKGDPKPWVPPKEKSKWTAEDYYNMYQEEHAKAFDNAPDVSNDFEQHIKWTNEGRLWTFPINNEQGMTHEENVSFQDHVFLDDKLNENGWCPSKGPIRLFMKAVITSLSRNPYFSVKEKHEHIEWFEDYFTEKLGVLKTLGLVNNDQQQSQTMVE